MPKVPNLNIPKFAGEPKKKFICFDDAKKMVKRDNERIARYLSKVKKANV